MRCWQSLRWCPVRISARFLSIFLFWLCILVPNVWIRPNNQRREADAAKALLTVPDGDHLTLLNVYNQYVNSTNHFACLSTTRILPLYKTNTIRIGRGRTIYLLVHWHRLTMFVRNCKEPWSVSMWILSPSRMKRNFTNTSGKLLSVVSSCKWRTRKVKRATTWRLKTTRYVSYRAS